MPPTLIFSATPIPPVTLIAPVVVLMALVVFVTFTTSGVVTTPVPLPCRFRFSLPAVERVDPLTSILASVEPPPSPYPVLMRLVTVYPYTVEVSIPVTTTLTSTAEL